MTYSRWYFGFLCIKQHFGYDRDNMFCSAKNGKDTAANIKSSGKWTNKPTITGLRGEITWSRTRFLSDKLIEKSKQFWNKDAMKFGVKACCWAIFVTLDILLYSPLPKRRVVDYHGRCRFTFSCSRGRPHVFVHVSHFSTLRHGFSPVMILCGWLGSKHYLTLTYIDVLRGVIQSLLHLQSIWVQRFRYTGICRYLPVNLCLAPGKKKKRCRYRVPVKTYSVFFCLCSCSLLCTVSLG